MGTFYAECSISNHVHRDKSVEVPKALVDTGSELTWISANILQKIGVISEKKNMLFALADGRTVSREVGFAVIRVAEHFTVDEVVFALEGDLQILGARTLEGLNLTVDPAHKRLVAAGPLPAAACA